MDNRIIEEVRRNETKLINEIKVLEQQCKNQKEVIDNAIDKLYCWGEALDPAFQKDLLDILNEVS